MIMCYCEQDISFLVATKTFQTPVVSWFAKKMKSIPVERPQDLARNGTGKVRVESERVIRGIGT